jgi:SAM-dependent methyltransferase
MGQAAVALPTGSHAPPIASCETPHALSQRLALVKPPCFWPALPGKASLSQIERAGLIRLADSIPGVCDAEEMVALIEAMRHAPTGDVVEVGSGSGRTAALLVWLARRYQIGAVLCLDAWDPDGLADFEIDLAPIADGRLNYMPADEASAYGEGLVVRTATFGDTSYQGRIALLRLNAADEDAMRWKQAVTPGGWIIFGGETNAGEAFLDANRANVCAAFRAGDSRFIQLKR